MKTHTSEEKNILTKFLFENNLTPENKLYRYTSKEYLKKIDNQLYIESKASPTDMLIEIYHGFGEVYIASEVAQGLSFLSKREDEYNRSDRVCVEIKLKDVIDQGGLVYTVTSLPAYLKVFFCTLPEGKIKVVIN